MTQKRIDLLQSLSNKREIEERKYNMHDSKTLAYISIGIMAPEGSFASKERGRK